jgi:hypothetical protein
MQPLGAVNHRLALPPIRGDLDRGERPQETAGGGAVKGPCSHTTATGLAQVVIGEDPFETEKPWHKMYRANSYSGRRGVVCMVCICNSDSRNRPSAGLRG